VVYSPWNSIITPVYLKALPGRLLATDDKLLWII
jgi:hypothetical protein